MKTCLSTLLLAVSLLFLTAPGPNDQQAIGRKGAVVSAHPLASKVGIEVLKKGGNAVDAAIAIFFALSVVHPQAGNIGGGGFMLVYGFKDGGFADRALALDFREVAPRRATRDMFLDANRLVVPGSSLRSALAVGVPGSVAGVCMLHSLFGSKPLEELLAPAIALAAQGFEVDHRLAGAIGAKRKALARWPATAKIFLPDGKVPRPGSRFRQRDLGQTLQRISEQGPDGFYKGETAELFEAEMQKSDGLIDVEDLAAYRPKARVPVTGQYRGHKIISMPPPSSGGVALIQMLNMLEPYDLRASGFASSKTLHLLIEVMKRAFADRARWLGDADFYPVPVEGLLAREYAKKLSATISIDKATEHVDAGKPKGAVLRESRETTHFSVMDAQGRAVSCTTTLNSSFGNGQVVAGAGFLLNNEMDDFSASPGVPNQFGLVGAKANEIAPGKRMLSSMTPTIVLDKEGKKVLLVLGSPGGGRIITTVLQVVLNVIDHRLPLHMAVAAPRIHQQWRPREVSWERLALTADTRAALEAMGHAFARGSRSMGHCQAILRKSEDRIEAAADPRSGGAALAW